jgi:cation transport protein ChaC
VWIFGYGSIVWRPAFPFEERVIARADGLARRFWQKSTDHRGVPGAPGRVCTLVDHSDEHCWGVAFRLRDDDAEREQIIAQLDHREKNGYEQRSMRLATRRGDLIDATTYIATEDNDDWWGPAPVDVIAEVVAVAEGPSGTNREYVLKLAEALRALGVHCHHTFAVEAALLKLLDDA